MKKRNLRADKQEAPTTRWTQYLNAPPTASRRVLVGKRFTRQVADEFPDGTRLFHFDERDGFSERKLDHHARQAIEQLERAGIPAKQVIEKHLAADGRPGLGMVLDYVINSLDHDWDSFPGLAARIYEACIEMQFLLALTAPKDLERALWTHTLMYRAFELGRLLTLQDVYDSQTRDPTIARELQGKTTCDKVRAAWEDDAAAGKPERGRIKRVALSLQLSESAVRRALDLLQIPRKRKSQKRR